MPRQSNGQYVAPANTAAVSGQAISSTAFNTLETDIGTEITNSLDRGGRSAMTAALPMGGNKITGLAEPTVSTDAATKNYADTITAAFFSTGDVKLTLKTAADAGWLIFDNGTFGSASSGSSNRANADTQPLFTLLYNNVVDGFCPILTSGGGATTRAAQGTAAAAWAANCRMTLPKTLGRALAIAGSNGGPAGTWQLGQNFGEEVHTLTVAELPSITPTGTFTGTALGGGADILQSGILGNGGLSAGYYGQSHGPLVPAGSITLNPFGGGGTHNNMQPTVFMNAMVKL